MILVFIAFRLLHVLYCYILGIVSNPPALHGLNDRRFCKLKQHFGEAFRIYHIFPHRMYVRMLYFNTKSEATDSQHTFFFSIYQWLRHKNKMVMI